MGQESSKIKNICLFPSLNFWKCNQYKLFNSQKSTGGYFYYNCNFCHICWKLIRGTYELVGPSNQFSDHTFYVKSKLKLFSSRFLWAKYFVLITFSNFGLWNITQGFFTFWGFLAQNSFLLHVKIKVVFYILWFDNNISL